MADPNWADRGSYPNANTTGNSQSGAPVGHYGPPKAGMNPSGANNPMLNQGPAPSRYGPPQNNQGPQQPPNYNPMTQRPLGPGPMRPPGHFGAAPFQPTSATPPPQVPLQGGIPRSSSSPSMPPVGQGPINMVNGLPNGPPGPSHSQVNGQMQGQPPLNRQYQPPQMPGIANQPRMPGIPPRMSGALPVSQSFPRPPTSQTTSSMSGPVRPGFPPVPSGVPQPGPAGVPNANLGPTRPVAPPTPSVGAPPSGSESSRPTELPLPYHGQGQYSQQHGPGLTPSGSEPPSQKSSRAPSPVPGQKYDALEGQFSPQGGVTPVQEQSQGSQPWQQPPRFSQPGQPPQPPRPYMPQPGAPGQQISPPGALGQPPPPNSVGQPPPIGGQWQQPPSGQNQPMPPGGQGQHFPPGGQGQSFPPGGQGQPFPPGGQGQPIMPPSVQGQPPLAPGQNLPDMPGGQNAVVGSGITGRRQYPQMAPGSNVPAPVPNMAAGGVPQPTYPVNNMAGGVSQPSYPVNNLAGGVSQQQPAYPINSMYPGTPHSAANSQAQLSTGFNNMKLQADANRPINLLQEKNVMPVNGCEAPKPDLPLDYKKANCHPDIFRCTLNSIPNTQSLLSKSRLPLGILIHPFRDLADDEYPVIFAGEDYSQLPVIQSSVIVRCKSCRTYINPFVTFIDSRRWKCNLCYRSNELPEEFNYDPVTKTYGEPQRRPEIKSGTIEFIAPSEYMLRPPQPAVYLIVLDVSFNARGTGYLHAVCQTILEELDRFPGDARTMIGFLAFDRSLYFFNLAEGLSQPQLLVVSDVDEIFLPSPDNLLVNLQESKELVIDLLNILPEMFKDNIETGSALGPALEASYKLLHPTGGRVSVFQTQLPSVGNGALKSREDPNERSGKKIQHLGPATDFYKRLALECSAQQIAVDLFMLNSQYADMSSIACISKYSGGSLHYFPGYHNVTNPTETERFEGVLRRYFSRKIGFEAVMRIRCSRGLSLHTFHGNFFVRSTDLLSLPNVNPDAAFGMQMSIEDTIEANYVCFQAALLYTSSKGERRIRVHTLAVPVSSTLSEIHANADQQAIIGLLAKMAVDKSLSASMGDARDALLNSAIDMLGAYGNTLTSSQRLGQLPCPNSLRLQPLYISAMLKSVAFRVGSSTKLDDRVYTMEMFKNLPLCFLIMLIYPNLYPVHNLDDKQNVSSKGDLVVPQPPLLQLSSAYMDRHGVYLLDTGTHMTMWVGAAVSDQFCQEVFERPHFGSLPEAMLELPELENPTSELIRTFISHLNDQRPYPAPLLVLREDSKSRHLFLQHMVEDHTESTMSYYEFLQHLQKEVRS